MTTYITTVNYQTRNLILAKYDELYDKPNLDVTRMSAGSPVCEMHLESCLLTRFHMVIEIYRKAIKKSLTK